jgi:hypothetical protein
MNLQASLGRRFLEKMAVGIARLFDKDNSIQIDGGRLGLALRYLKVQKLRSGQLEPILAAISKALEGDSIALRLCMDRIAPPMKDKPVVFPLAKMRDALDASKAAGSVLSAVSDGSLTPIEGTRVMGLIDSYRRTLELMDIEQRLHQLETTNAGP